jgi:hypothetical protein
MKTHIYYLPIFVALTISQSVANEMKTDEWGSLTNNVQMSINVIPANTFGSFRIAPGATNMQMTTGLEKAANTLKANQPFSLLVRIKNTSTDETYSSYVAGETISDPGKGLLCVVISPAGKDISPPTKDITHYNYISGSLGITPPNRTNQFEFKLSDICRFDQIGTYKIIAQKRMNASKNHKAFMVVSNPLNVTVVPDK